VTGPSRGGAQDAPRRRPLPSPRQVRRRVQDRERATVSRDQLAAAHEGFDAVSPTVGRLDEGAMRSELARDGDAAVALLADLAVATDPQLRREARRLARRLMPPLGRAGEPRRPGTRRMVSRAQPDGGDLDLDRTLERSCGRRPRDPAELVVRRFAAAPRAVCLLVDRSGSMSGHAVALAAVAAAAVVGARSERLRCSVVAFAAEPLVLLGDGSRRAAGGVVDDLLSLRGHGTTDLARALHVAADQLQAVPPGGRTALLMSDAQFTAGADPFAVAGRFDCLHVLGTSEESDSIAAAVRLARRGGGRYLPAARLSQLAESLALALAL
jgi:magnesium chelatase subunit D